MKDNFHIEYPLQGSHLDRPLSEVLNYSYEDLDDYINAVLVAFEESIDKGEFTLAKRVSFKDEMRELRKVLRQDPESCLATDDNGIKVLKMQSPGGAHKYWSRYLMWQMQTKQGNLEDKIREQTDALYNKLFSLLDDANPTRQLFRKQNKTAIQNILEFLRVDFNNSTAFNPSHAKFLASRYLPRTGDCLIVDPCAGWGGRLLGTQLVDRKDAVRYIGCDVESRNAEVYKTLQIRLNHWLLRELPGFRDSTVYIKPFEQWVRTTSAKSIMGKVDLVMTSPPYFDTENYNPRNKNQSANKYLTYYQWKKNFYYPLIASSYELLNEGGVFILNVADVKSAEVLEKHALEIAETVGFVYEDYYAMQMQVQMGSSKSVRHPIVLNGRTYKSEPVFVFRKV